MALKRSRSSDVKSGAASTRTSSSSWSARDTPASTTEIRVELDRPGNFVRFRLSPDVAISLGARTKAPGEAMAGEDVELVVKNFETGEMTPYERLLGDAIRGDAMLFVREDEVEAAWTVVAPVLGDASPIHIYAPGTWGPPEADAIVPPPKL